MEKQFCMTIDIEGHRHPRVLDNVMDSALSALDPYLLHLFVDWFFEQLIVGVVEPKRTERSSPDQGGVRIVRHHLDIETNAPMAAACA
jgi:hypothetical protein